MSVIRFFVGAIVVVLGLAVAALLLVLGLVVYFVRRLLGRPAARPVFHRSFSRGGPPRPRDRPAADAIDVETIDIDVTESKS